MKHVLLVRVVVGVEVGGSGRRHVPELTMQDPLNRAQHWNGTSSASPYPDPLVIILTAPLSLLAT